MIPHKLIICAPKNANELQKRYPNKTVVSEIYAKNDQFIFARKYPKGVFMVKMNDWSVWLPAEFPYFRKYRPKK